MLPPEVGEPDELDVLLVLWLLLGVGRGLVLWFGQAGAGDPE